MPDANDELLAAWVLLEAAKAISNLPVDLGPLSTRDYLALNTLSTQLVAFSRQLAAVQQRGRGGSPAANAVPRPPQPYLPSQLARAKRPSSN